MLVFYADTPRELLNYVCDFVKVERDKALARSRDTNRRPGLRKTAQDEAAGLGGVLAVLATATVQPKAQP
jgi:hypothetical protein